MKRVNKKKQKTFEQQSKSVWSQRGSVVQSVDWTLPQHDYHWGLCKSLVLQLSLTFQLPMCEPL